MHSHRDSQQRRQGCRDALQTAVEDLRAALADEQGGNDQVRDCAFEVVAAWDAEAARTPTLETSQRLTRLLAGLNGDLAQTCRRTDVTRERGVVVNLKRALLDLESQLQRFVTTADVFRHRRRVHGRGGSRT